MGTLPVLIFAATFALAIPIGLYMAWVFEGRYRAPGVLRWVERLVDTGSQSWKQYALAFMLFNLVTFVVGFAVLTLQPYLPLNPDGKGMLSPSMIFHTVISFMTNTNLQHYSGDQHLSNFSQIFFILPNMFLSASVGFCALAVMVKDAAATFCVSKPLALVLRLKLLSPMYWAVMSWLPAGMFETGKLAWLPLSCLVPMEVPLS